MGQKLPWPPKKVVTPEGETLDVVDTEADGAYLILENGRRAVGITVRDPVTEWKPIYDE